MCDILYIMFARQTRACAVHMDHICRRRCAHMWGTHGAAHCAPPHVRTSSQVYARKRPRANSQFRYVALPFLVSDMMASCTSCVIGFVWNSSNLSVRKCSVVVCNNKMYRESPRHTLTYFYRITLYNKSNSSIMHGVIRIKNEHNVFYCYYLFISVILFKRV